MIEEITTNVVRCDGENCDKSFADVVQVSADVIERFALRNRWSENEGKHYCPQCQKEGKTK